MYKKVLYPAAFLFSIWFFFRGIPLDTQDAHTGLLGCIGAIIGIVLGLMAVFKLFPLKEKEGAQKYEGDNSGYFIFGGIIVFLVAYGMLFISDVLKRKKTEMETNSGFAMGTVVDGSSMKTRRADFSSLTLKYRAMDGNEYTADIDISASQFANYYMYQKIPLRYSKKYPQMVEQVRDQALLQKLRVEAMPAITVHELTKVFSINTPEAVATHLNGINKQWTYSFWRKDTVVYNNQLKHISIKTSGKNKLVYTHDTLDNALFGKQLKELGFLPIPASGTDEALYKNNQFLVKVGSSKVIGENNSFDNLKQVTSVEIIKLDKEAKTK
jgi:hypothetical protein